MRFSAVVRHTPNAPGMFDWLPFPKSSSAAGERSRLVPFDEPGLAFDGTRRGASSVGVASECVSDGGVSRSVESALGDVAFGGREGSDLSSSMALPFSDGFILREEFFADFFRRLSISDS